RIERIENPKSLAAKIASDVKASTTALVTIGAVQTVEGIATDHSPVRQRYDGDEARREDQLARFGQRVLWPGDSTRGGLFFRHNTPLRAASIELPMHALYDAQDKALVVVPLAQK